MTKPKNFPGRKHERRIRAFQRMQDYFPISDLTVHEMVILQQRIATGGIRFTKKDRSARGKLRRE